MTLAGEKSKDLALTSSALTQSELKAMDGYWRAANYLSVGQIYLLDNPLLREPLHLKHVKRRLLGHWGTTPGLNFIYVHLNRIIKKYDLNMIYVCGPGHGGPGIVANTYLESTYSELYPSVSQNIDGMKALFKQFSFPGGIPSHCAPEIPGSINEGGELGYSLAHAYGAILDNPALVACCVVGDGEAETGALATSWHSNKFVNPETDGVVLPILHLNGYKIANPTVLARLPQDELQNLFLGYGYKPYFVEGSEPEIMHQKMAATLDIIVSEIKDIKNKNKNEINERPLWPMIILRTPKGWTGPKFVDGLQIEGTFRSHQVPLAELVTKPEHLKMLEDWLKSYKPNELFDNSGRLKEEFHNLAPKGDKRMSANPHANGGLLLQDLNMPDFRKYAISVDAPGKNSVETTRILGNFIRDIIKLNPQNFRLLGPDETNSNRLGAVFEVTDREFTGEIYPNDDHIAKKGRVLEVLSEQLCQGWLEGIKIMWQLANTNFRKSTFVWYSLISFATNYARINHCFWHTNSHPCFT